MSQQSNTDGSDAESGDEYTFGDEDEASVPPPRVPGAPMNTWDVRPISDDAENTLPYAGVLTLLLLISCSSRREGIEQMRTDFADDCYSAAPVKGIDGVTTAEVSI